jgi:hypothetical protein
VGRVRWPECGRTERHDKVQRGEVHWPEALPLPPVMVTTLPTIDPLVGIGQMKPLL